TRGAYLVISEVEAVDDVTLKVVTDEPFPDLLSLLQHNVSSVVDPTEIEKHSDPRDYGLQPVGSGPYMVTEWEAGTSIELVKNPHYTNHTSNVDTLIYRSVPEPGTRMAMLRSGEAHLVTDPVPE